MRERISRLNMPRMPPPSNDKMRFMANHRLTSNILTRPVVGQFELSGGASVLASRLVSSLAPPNWSHYRKAAAFDTWKDLRRTPGSDFNVVITSTRAPAVETWKCPPSLEKPAPPSTEKRRGSNSPMNPAGPRWDR